MWQSPVSLRRHLSWLTESGDFGIPANCCFQSWVLEQAYLVTSSTLDELLNFFTWLMAFLSDLFFVFAFFIINLFATGSIHLQCYTDFLTVAGGERKRLVHAFPKMLEWNEMQSVSSKIWTRDSFPPIITVTLNALSCRS